MAYVSLYRKWRPQTFADVVGQVQAVQTLKNALDHDRLSHAYLFCGPRGVGKTTVARLIAKGLNCVHGPTSDPCNQCPACEKIARGVSLDVIEIDAASNRGIDEIRDLRDKVRFAPTEGKYKVYIIDEVHMLTTDAFNALLKTLEEPPEHVVFILATTEPQKIPSTILSRCQRYDFRSLTADEIVERLSYVAAQEGISATREALFLIAKHAEGGMRDALGFLDQCAAFAEGQVTENVVADVLGIVPQEQLWKFVSLLVKGDAGACIELLQEIVFMGKDLRQFAKDTAAVFRTLLLTKLGQGTSQSGEHYPEELLAIRDTLPIERFVDILEQLGQLDNELRSAVDERIPFELGIIRITSLRAGHAVSVSKPASKEIDELRQQLQELRSTVKTLEERLSAMVNNERGGRPLSVPLTAGVVAVTPVQTVDRSVGSGTGTSGIDDVSGGRKGVSSQMPSAEPVPQAAGVSQADAVTVAANSSGISKIRQVWDSIFDVLKQERQASLGAFLREAKPAAVTSDGRLLLAFPPDRGFHKASVEQPKMKEMLERVIARLTGNTYAVQCEFGTPEEVAARYGIDAATAGRSDEEARENHGGSNVVSESPKEPRENTVEAEAELQVGSEADSGELDLGENDPIVKAALDIFKGKLIKLK